MRFFFYAVLIVAVICTANFSLISAAPGLISESKRLVRRDTSDGEKKGDFLSAVETAANAAKLVAQYGCPIARLAYTQCNREQIQGGYDQKLFQATWDHVTKDIDQSEGATVTKAIREYGCPAVGLVTKLCVLV